MKTDLDAESVLRQPLMANLATMAPDGPRNSPVWFLWEDDALWMLGSEQSSSVRRLSADSRCAVEIVEFDAEAGLLRHVGLRGTAEVLAMDTDLFRRLLAKYLGSDETGWNPWFIKEIARIDDPEGRLIRLYPTSIFTNDASFFKTGPALASG